MSWERALWVIGMGGLAVSLAAVLSRPAEKVTLQRILDESAAVLAQPGMLAEDRALRLEFSSVEGFVRMFYHVSSGFDIADITPSETYRFFALFRNEALALAHSLDDYADVVKRLHALILALEVVMSLWRANLARTPKNQRAYAVLDALHKLKYRLSAVVRDEFRGV
jgi:hypothetical protein